MRPNDENNKQECSKILVSSREIDRKVIEIVF